MAIKYFVGNKIVGLSGDSKPTNVVDGATFYETDTLKLFIKDGTWKEISGSSGYSGYSGKSGYSGYSGKSGYSGYSGVSGTTYAWKGEWDSETVYVVNDCAGYNGAGYISIQNGTNKNPASETAYWDLLVASGYSGYSGKSGYSGYSGVSGYSGYSGAESDSGYSGYSGISGYSGYSGISGYSGYSGEGTSGYSGYSGISGYSGYSSASGYSGYSGISGYSGYSGISGYSGYSGEDGDSGYSGYSGYSGSSGYSGYSGISGYSGYSGISGYSGYSGISGYSGYSGKSGYSGYSGTSGYSGYSGISGYSGTSGYSGVLPIITAAPGSDHTADGIKIILTSTGTFNFGDVGYIKSDGTVGFADASVIATASAMVMCADAQIDSTSGNWLLLGIARDDTWAWTVGGLVYLTITGTTGNTLSQTKPTATDEVVVIVGVATHADRMYVNPQLVTVELV